MEEGEEGVSLNYIIFTVIIGLLLLLNWLGIFKTFLGIDTAIILTLIGGYKIFFGALESLFKRKISVDLAIALAAIAALSINQYLAAAEVVFIMLVGEALESFAVDRTRGAIKKLIDLSPKKARVIRNGEEREIEVEKLVVGDRVMVRPGERIPVDGDSSHRPLFRRSKHHYRRVDSCGKKHRKQGVFRNHQSTGHYGDPG